mmetsp:Transcript_12072/g.28610  ORF Transcript_12072/g.28610 Transcript_12072/m.28610 type:complete len:466 (-) Transcript_12072:401-1798(-)|eukprot:CAMPEP_0197174210 /NCGR_PEP_ID=MMETSP1423-20130617/831_1 /TAXON_ID=476441 /ORGANISM="Pseudo-nitzschia heimii, Strain UNC1101" /LENGTH=465 /DNA_ID=CAMNT_0042623113 /DNA_START=115 /DNA_END=1512 /DNA_ORIENTATION=+
MASSEVEFLEDRLALLETWLESTEDDENNEDLIQKREEYRGLIEETVLLQRKLRKTSKLLSTEISEKMVQKLLKKQDQYLCEIEEIMNYAESDVLFETSEIEPNELLGEPLETLMEQPGMEGSSASLNFSLSDFMPQKIARIPLSSSTDLPEGDELHPIAETSGGLSFAKCNESMNSVSTGFSALFSISTAGSNTYNYDEKTLRKKLKKVENLLATGEMKNSNSEMCPLDSKQLKKLRKKREQYSEALEHKINNGKKSSKHANETDEKLGVREQQLYDDSHMEESGESEMEEGEIQDEERSDDSPIRNGENHNYNSSSSSYDPKTLKKKLKKLKILMAATSDVKEIEIYKKKKKEYKKALETFRNEEMEVALSSPSRPSQNVLPEDGELDDECLSPSHSTHSYSHHQKSNSEENDDQLKSLQKKIRKADKSIAKARKEGDQKKLKKIEKKRQEYQTFLTQLLSNR